MDRYRKNRNRSGTDDTLSRRAKQGSLDETLSMKVQHHQIDLLFVGDPEYFPKRLALDHHRRHRDDAPPFGWNRVVQTAECILSQRFEFACHEATFGAPIDSLDRLQHMKHGEASSGSARQFK